MTDIQTRPTIRRFLKGFTTLQMVAALSAMVILVGIAMPKQKSIQDTAKTMKAKSTLKTVKAAVEGYKIGNKKYPPKTGSLVKDHLMKAKPKLVDQDMPDPFGGDLGYAVTPDRSKYALSSKGADGESGTSASIVNGAIITSGDDLVDGNVTVVRLPTGVTCGSEETNCNGVCITTSTNASHCGDCDTVCSGASNTCVAGVCKCGNNAACSGTTDTCTDGVCLCGVEEACFEDEVCVAGACVTPTPTPTPTPTATATPTEIPTVAPSVHIITFDANGGAGAMSPQTMVVDTPEYLTANSFTREGYIFSGWALTVNGEAVYADGASYTMAAVDDVTLYAQWTADVCTATGGTVTTEGNYKIHVFTGSGTLSVSDGCTAEVLVVAGGGGGGPDCGGGGGAGGLIHNTSYVLTAGGHTITVGSGGTSGPAGSTPTKGGNSVFDALVAFGGGTGRYYYQNPATSGGSGGGGGDACTYADAAAAGVDGQGHAGSSFGDGVSAMTGGGGGAGGPAVDGDGGPGLYFSQFASVGGSPAGWFAGGGGYMGGNGGGGNSDRGSRVDGYLVPMTGVANTGGGGGGGYGGEPGAVGGAGGSGVVIVRYLWTDPETPMPTPTPTDIPTETPTPTATPEASYYTVTYNDNGSEDGTVPTDATEYEAGASVTVLGNTGMLTRDGYTFGGWNTQVTGNGTNYVVDETFPMGVSNVTLYARWTAGTSGKVWFFNPNVDNTWENLANWTSNYDGTGSHPPAIPWTTEATKDDDLRPGQNYVNVTSVSVLGREHRAPSSNIEFVITGEFSGDGFESHAFILGGTFTGSGFVSYDGISGGTFTGAGFVNYDSLSGSTVTGSDFVNNGYIYDGTFTGSGFVNNGWIVNGTFTGAGFVNNAVVYGGRFSGASFTISGTNFSFAPGGDSLIIADGVDITIDASCTNMTLRNWQEENNGHFIFPYTVTYDKNDGMGDPPVDSHAYANGFAFTILGDGAMYKSGYTFSGWNTANGSGDHYAPGDTPTMGAANVRLYAEWTDLDECANGSDNCSESAATCTNTEGAFTCACDTGYEGDGVTCTANQYTVSFEGNGADSGSMDALTVSHGVPFDVPANAFSRAGYALMIWRDNASGDYCGVGSICTATSDMTLSAQWVSLYEIVFDANGGSGSMVEQIFAAPTPPQLSSNEFTRVGHSFSGWNTAPDGSGTSYAAGEIYSGGSATLYAQWTATSYVVTFDGHGADDGSMAVQEIPHGSSAPLAGNGFGRVGYVFTGWNTVDNGSGTSYTDGGNCSPVSDMTLYAQWTLYEFTITFDANGGSGTMAEQKIPYGASAPLSANTFTREGYTFAGWTLTQDGPLGINFVDGQSVSFLGETLYAQWTPNNYTVTFDANGGSGTMSAQTIAYSTSANLTANAFTRTGYAFAGWATTSGGAAAYANGASYTLAAPANVTLYARWNLSGITVHWTGAVSGSLNDAGNYDVRLPTSVDSLDIPAGLARYPSSGTLGFVALTNAGAIGGGTFNCTGPVTNNGTISGGSFSGYSVIGKDIVNNGTISAGTFSSVVENSGIISGGTFTASYVNNHASITGGSFTTTVFNLATVAGGNFYVMYNHSIINGGNFSAFCTNLGTISGGNFNQKRSEVGGTVAPYPSTVFTDD